MKRSELKRLIEELEGGVQTLMLSRDTKVTKEDYNINISQHGSSKTESVTLTVEEIEKLYSFIKH